MDDPLRGSGRTTRQALEYANLAIHDAGLPVTIRDHYRSAYSDIRLVSMTAALLNALDVPHTINVKTNQITVEPIPQRNRDV